MKGNDETPLRWVVTRMDTTHNWNFTASPPEGPRPTRMWTVYLCSLDLGVHICSFTPSAEMWFVENYPEWDNDVEDSVRDAWSEWPLPEEDEEVVYMDLSTIRRKYPDLAALHQMEEPAWKGTPRSGDNWCYVDTAPSTETESLLEYVRCNSMI